MVMPILLNFVSQLKTQTVVVVVLSGLHYLNLAL